MAGKPSRPPFAILPLIFLLIHTGFLPTEAAPSQVRADGDLNARLRGVSVGSESSRAQPLQKMENVPSSLAAVRSQTALAAITKQVTSGGSFVELHNLVGTALNIKSKNPNATVTFSLPASALPESIGSGTPYNGPESFSLFSASAEGDEGPDPLAQSLSAAASTVLVNTSTGTFYKAGIQSDTLELMGLLIQVMRQHPGSSVTVTLRDTGTPAPGESPLQVGVRLDAAFSSEYATPVVSWDGGDGVASAPKATLPLVNAQDHGPGDTRPLPTMSAMTVPSGLPPPPASLSPAVEVNLDAPLLSSPSVALPTMPLSSEMPTLAPSWAPAPSQSPGGSSGPRLEPASMPSSLAHSAASPGGLLSQPLASPTNLSIKVISRGQQPPPSPPRMPPVSHHAGPDADSTDQPSAGSPSAPPVYCCLTSRPVVMQQPQGPIEVAPTSSSPINVPPAYMGSLPVPRSSPSLYDFTPPTSVETNSAPAYNGLYLPSPTPPTQSTNPPSYPDGKSLPPAWPLSPNPQTLSQSSPGHSAATMQNPTMRPSQHPGSVPAPHTSQSPVQPIFLPTYPPMELAVPPSRPWRSRLDKPPAYADLTSLASQQASPSPSYISQLQTEHEELQPSRSLPIRPMMQFPASYGLQPSIAPPAGPAVYPSMPLAPSPWASLPAPSKPASAPVYSDSPTQSPQQQLPMSYPTNWRPEFLDSSTRPPTQSTNLPVVTASPTQSPPFYTLPSGSMDHSRQLPASPQPMHSARCRQPEGQIVTQFSAPGYPSSPPPYGVQPPSQSLHQPTQPQSLPLPSYPAPPAQQPGNVRVYFNILPPHHPMHPSPALGQQAASRSEALLASNFPSPEQPSRRSPSGPHSGAVQSPSYVPSASVQPTMPLAYPIRQPPTYTSSAPLQHRLGPPADQRVSGAQPPIYSSLQFGPARLPPSYALSASQLPMQSGTVQLVVSPLPPHEVAEELQPSGSEPTATLPPSNGPVELQPLNSEIPQNVPPPRPMAEASPQIVRLDPLTVSPGAAIEPGSRGKTSLGSPQLPSIPLPPLKPPKLSPPPFSTPSSARDMQLEQIRSQIQAMLDFILASNGGGAQLNISRMPSAAAPASRSVPLVAGEMKPPQQSPSQPLPNIQEQIVAQGGAGGPRRMMLHRARL